MNRKGLKKISLYILRLFLVLLPVDSALGNIIGSISLINYVGITYILIRFILLFIVERKINLINFKKNTPLIIFVIYFIVLALFKQGTQFNTFFYESFLMSFIIFFCAVTDDYDDYDVKIIKKSILISFCSVLLAYFFLATTENNRLVFNSQRSMDPNFFACGLCLLNACIFNEIFVSKKKMIYILMLIFLFIIILLTGSRSGIAANLIVLFILFFKNSNISFSKKILYFIFILSLIAIFIVNIENIIPANVLDRFSLNYIIEDSGAGRFDIWKKGFEFWKNNSIVREFFGTGPGTFQYLVTHNGHAAHNIYLQIFVEEGLLGMFLFILTIISICKNNYKNGNYIMLSVFLGILLGGVGIDIDMTRFFWICIFLSLCNFNISKGWKNE